MARLILISVIINFFKSWHHFELRKVSKLTTPEYSERSLLYPESWRNKKLKWEIGDPLECSDCGHHPGDVRQYAACYFKDSVGGLQPCDHRFMMNQVLVQKCHIPCRPKVSYRTSSSGCIGDQLKVGI